MALKPLPQNGYNKSTISALAIGIVIGYLIGRYAFHEQSSPYANTDLKPSKSNECTDWTAPAERVLTDPWYSMKMLLKPAKCTVKGFAIEELDPVTNFRRPFSLGFINFVEDRSHVPQFMLASQDLSLQNRKRRVLMDFGGKTFDTSIAWFLRHYPLDFTEVHVFEVEPGRFVVPSLHPPAIDKLKLLPNSPRHLVKPKRIPNWQLERIKVYNSFVSISDGEISYKGKTSKTVNITRFIKEELNLTSEDALIVKMDIEGAEWEVLPAWISDPEMPKIVDELYVEIHYRDPSMDSFNWNITCLPNGTATPPRSTANDLLVQLRKKGFFAHAWP